MRLRFQAFILLAIASVLPIHAQNRGAPASPKMVTLRRGHSLQLELLTPLDSGSAKIGDEISFRIFLPVTVDGQIVIPEGWLIYAHIDDVRHHRKNCKDGNISWRFDQVNTSGGTTLSLRPAAGKRRKAANPMARVAKGIALAPVVVVLSPILIPLLIGMHGEGCGGAYGIERKRLAGTVVSAKVAHDVRLPIVP